MGARGATTVIPVALVVTSLLGITLTYTNFSPENEIFGFVMILQKAV